MTIYTATVPIELDAGETLLVPAGTEIVSIDSLTVRVSYDYEPFRLITAPAFEFTADRLTRGPSGVTIERDVPCISYPGGNGRPRTHQEKG